MNKTPPNQRILFFLHIGLVILATSFILHLGTGHISLYPLITLDSNQSPQTLGLTFSSDSHTVPAQSTQIVSVMMSSQGEYPTTLSLDVTYPQDRISLGTIQSPDPTCEHTLDVVPNSTGLTLQCSLGPTPITTIFSISYVPVKAGSAIMGLSPDSSARNSQGIILIKSQSTLITITP